MNTACETLLRSRKQPSQLTNFLARREQSKRIIPAACFSTSLPSELLNRSFLRNSIFSSQPLQSITTTSQVASSIPHKASAIHNNMSSKEMIEELSRLCDQLQLDITNSKDTGRTQTSDLLARLSILNNSQQPVPARTKSIKP
jgi:hypothetical protein